MNELLPLARPVLAGNEGRYLQECIESNFVSSVGPFVERFEREFASAVGSRHAIACSTGTAALHIALLLLGCGPGSEVAVSTLTFIASVNAISYTGARPLLVDSESATWNLDGEMLLDEVRRRAAVGEALPSAVEAVHLLGHPVDMEPLIELRDRYGVALLEDAAEALGASYQGGPAAGRQVGTVGTLGCFSFNGNKVITTGGGGMITTDDPSLARRARHLTQQAKCAGRAYMHDEVGFNYRLTNVAAALGVAQLEQLPTLLRAKRAIAAHYDDALTGLGVQLPPRAPWADPSYWLYSIMVASESERDEVLDHLETEGIQARPIWSPAHRQPPYRRANRLGGEVADGIHARSVSLPCSADLEPDQQERVVAALAKIIGP